MEIYIALIGLILSFFFAGSEAAFTAFDKIRLDIWTKQKIKLAEHAVKFIQKPEKFFSTILVGNNIANILCTAFATVFLIRYIDETIAWIIIMLSVLFFGEILPKSLFRFYADAIILKTMFLVQIFYIVLKPLIVSINFIVDLILDFLKINHESVVNYFSREEMEILLQENNNIAFLGTSERKYISKVLDFSGSKVREAMTPRTEIIAAEEGASWDDVHELMASNRRLRIPVYRESLDNIIGIVFIYDMMDQVKPIESLIKPVSFVPENKSCAELLREFQDQNISIAVVIDEYGGTAGLVTTDDLVEVVIGEFHLQGEDIPQVKALNDHTWLIDARIDLDELREIVNVEFSEGEYETFAGFLLETMGHIPKVKETADYNDFRIEITKASVKKIHQAKLIKKLAEDD
jgi:CBS domain containing-hemolysin-like protein